MSLELFNLKGKTAMIVGGSKGLGKGMALGLASAGANIILASRNKVALDEAALDIKYTTGSKAIGISFDVGKKGDIEKLVDSVVSSFKKIDILVNSAGLNIRKPILECTTEDWDRIMDVQLKGVFFTCQAIARQFIKQKTKGKIINIASLTSMIAFHDICIYGAAKGGIIQMSKGMAVEWAEHNINVNCIGPGYYKTEMTAPLFKNRETIEGLLRRIPMGRTGLPDDLIGTVIYLASDASDYVTGQVMYVDGGWLSA